MTTLFVQLSTVFVGSISSGDRNPIVIRTRLPEKRSLVPEGLRILLRTEPRWRVRSSPVGSDR